jgi:hypothetical protein
MNDTFTKKIENALSYISPSDSSNPSTISLSIDTLRSILSSFLSVENLTKACTTISDLIDSFRLIKEELEDEPIYDKIICLDTSELLSSIYPNYNWYYCLNSIFSEHRTLNFFAPPWFICEVYKGIQSRALSKANNREDKRVIREIEEQGYSKKYFESFKLIPDPKHISLEKSEWENIEKDLEIKFINSLKTICEKNTSIYFCFKFIKLFDMKLINSAEKLSLINSIEDYGRFAQHINSENNLLLDFRNLLLKYRNYYISKYNITQAKVLLNATVDSTVYGYINWILDQKKVDNKKLIILTRDSFYDTVRTFNKINDDYPRSFNPQSIYLWWILTKIEKNNYIINEICDHSIAQLIEVLKIIKEISGGDKAHKFRTVREIIIWLNDKIGIKGIKGELLWAVKKLNNAIGTNADEKENYKNVVDFLNQDEVLDEKVDIYIRLSEILVNAIDNINSRCGDNITPVFNEIGSWGVQLREISKLFKNTKAKLKILTEKEDTEGLSPR